MTTQFDTRDTTDQAAPQVPWSRNSSPSNGQHTAPDGGEGMARSLGWLSIGLGLAEVLTPRRVAKAAGTRNHASWIRASGVREIISGIGILTNRQPGPWVWSRVGGDLLDIASLGTSLRSRRNDRGRIVASLAAVAGVTALDVVAARKVSGGRNTTADRLEVSTIVNRSPDECYRFWRNFEELPRFMSYLRSVRVTGDGRSHWVAAGPGGATVEWDAEVVNDVPGQMISWRSLPGSDICTSGSVAFEAAPGSRGCIVRVQMEFSRPAYGLTQLTKIIGKHPQHMVYKDLRRFKQVMETGEAITTEGQSAGRKGSTTWLDSIAR